MATNETYVTIRGNLAADPVHRRLDNGVDVTTFRIGTSPRYQSNGQYVDGPTSWYNVSAWRNLAQNCAGSLSKGQPVVVVGKLRVRQWTDTGDDGRPRTGTSVDLEAQAVGHDLGLGCSAFRRVVRAQQVEREGQEEVEEMLDRLAGRFAAEAAEAGESGEGGAGAGSLAKPDDDGGAVEREAAAARS